MLFSTCVHNASAHPGYYGTAFHAHNLAEAQEFAQKEHKLVLAYVKEPAGKRFPLFRWRTAQNTRLLDLLVRETVITELDTAENAAEIAGYGVSAPEILLLSANGAVITRVAGDALTPQIYGALKPYLTGSAAVQRAEAALDDKGQDDFFTRERLAASLRSTGDHKGAISQYAWLMEQVRTESSKAAYSRAGNVYDALLEYSEENALAADLLDSQLAAAGTELLASQNDARKARRVAGVLTAQKSTERAKALFAKMDKNSRARRVLMDQLLDNLVAEQRYEEVLDLIEPAESLKGEIDMYKRMQVQRPAWAEKGTGRGTRSFVVQRTGNLVEALTGTGDEDKAKTLIEDLLSFDDSGKTQQALQQVLEKTGRTDLLTEAANQ